MARWLVLLVGILGCVDRGPGPQGKEIEPAYVRDHLLHAVPPTVTRLDVMFGGTITYAGNFVDKTQVAPGGAVHMSSYWQVGVPPGPGWRVFEIVRGEPGTADYMFLPATDMQIGHPPAAWKTGEVIEDDTDFVLRPDWKSKTATIYIGLMQVGGHDVGDRMIATGPNVVDRAVVARTLDVDLAKAPPPQGTVYVPHALAPIAVDGIGLETGWSGAVTSPDFVPAEGSPEPNGKATARMTWDEQNLYLFVSIVDPDIVSDYTAHDQPVWKQDAIEIFIDADSNRHGYVELQVSPRNVTFDKWWAQTRALPGDEAWDSGMVTAVKLRGTPAPNDTDQGWDAEIAIPWQAVKGRDDAMNVRLPPHVGDRWRMNVLRVDVRSGQNSPAAGGASSWNQITYQDFHALDRMMTVVFADKNGSIVPGQTGTGTGSGSAAGTGTGSGSAAGTATGTATGTGTATATGTGTKTAPATAPATGSASKTGSGSTPPVPPAAVRWRIAPGSGSAASP